MATRSDHSAEDPPCEDSARLVALCTPAESRWVAYKMIGFRICTLKTILFLPLRGSSEIDCQIPQKSASGPRRNFRDRDFGVAEVQCPIGNCLRMRNIGPQKHRSNRASSPRKKAKATVAVDRRGFPSYQEPL